MTPTKDPEPESDGARLSGPRGTYGTSNEELNQASQVAPEDPERPVTLLPIGMKILSAFQGLQNLAGGESAAFQGYLVTESERFAIWAQSLGLGRQGHASLDYRVRDAKVMRRCLADVLDGLNTHLNELRSIVAGERQALELEQNEDDGSSASSSQGADESPERGAADVASANSECLSSSSSFHEIDYRQNSITEAIDALYSLATKMRNPRNRPQRALEELYKHIPADSRERYIREREKAEIMIVTHIHRQSLNGALEQLQPGSEPSAQASQPLGPGDQPASPGDGPVGLSQAVIEQYASPPNFLLKRIGIANARRKQQFVYWKEHAARIRGDPAVHIIKQPDNPKGKGPLPEGIPAAPRSHTESRAAPSAPQQSLATSATRLDEKDHIHTYDVQSVISHCSRVSTVVTAQGQKLEWPSPPAHLTGGQAKFFTCPYCHVVCPERYLAKDSWRSHIIHDLEPYHCTYEDCSDPNRLYGSYQEWLDHESQHIRVWHCHRHALEFLTQPEYIHHLQDHPDAGPEQCSPELVSAVVGPSLTVRRECPLCPNVGGDVPEMQSHLRHHLERFALFSFPAEDLDGDEGAAGQSSDSRQVIQGRGRQVSLKRDFDDSSDILPSPSLDSNTPAEEDRTVLLGSLHSQFPLEPGVDSRSDPVLRWIEMVAKVEPDDGAPMERGSSSVPDDFANGPRPAKTSPRLYCPLLDCAYSAGQPMALPCENADSLIHHLADRHAKRRDLPIQDESTAVLLWAAENGHKAVVKLLLDNGADIESSDTRFGQSPLYWAAEEGHEAVAKLLLEKGANIESRDTECGQSPLSRAAEAGHEAVVKLLLEKGANVESRDTGNGQSPLSWAAKNGHEAVVKLLLDNGADIESRDTRFRESPLSWAAEAGQEAVVQLLLDNGADRESRSKNGQSPLSWASSGGHEAVVRRLLDNGADRESRSIDGKSPLSWAAERGHKEVVKLLLDNGADIESRDTEYGQSPLSWAAERRHEAVVKLLLDNGAHKESHNKDGTSPL